MAQFLVTYGPSIWVFLFGSAVGSFLNVVIARLPEGESVVRPRSRCPKCGFQLKAWQNIPILSWLILRGKCAGCSKPISLRYPVVELLTGVLFLACLARFGLTKQMIPALILASSLIAITFIDIDCFEIPDEISLPGILVGCALRPWAYDLPWYGGLVGALAGATLIFLIRVFGSLLLKKEAMGIGDIKLMAMLGAFLGPAGLYPTILVGSIAGSVIGITLILVRKARGEEEEEEEEAPESPKVDEESAVAEDGSDEEDEEWVPDKHAVPFGPFLALGALTALLFEPSFRTLMGPLFAPLYGL